MLIFITVILILLVVWGIVEFIKPVIIPLNEEEQKILKLLKDNIEGSESIADVGIDFDYIIIITHIKGLTFKHYKSFTHYDENVSLYLRTSSIIKTNDDKIYISSRLKNSILEILKPYSDKIISEEKERFDSRKPKEKQTKENRLQKVLEDIEIK